MLIRPHYYLGDHTILTELVYGPLMFLDPRDPVNMEILRFGCWEDWIGKIFAAVVKPGMTVLDIGAHSGYFSLLAGSLVGPSGSVHAFEPNPFHHKNFIKSKSINGYTNVHLNKVMLSDKPGKEVLRTYGEGGTSIFVPGLEAINGVSKVTVPVGVLTDYLPSPRADIIKIDIDGGEPFIMDSVFHVIDNSSSPAIFFEYLPMLWGGHDPLPILQGFANRGFKFFIITRDNQVLPTNVHDLAAFNGTVQLDLLLTR